MTDHNLAVTFITIGCLLLLGLLGEAIGQKTRLPRVTILILIGIVIGPVGLDLLPALKNHWFDYTATIALTMIGFLLGGKLNKKHIEQYGAAILQFSITITLGTFIVVFMGLLLIGVSTPLALLLAGISLATDPLATVDCIKETKQKSRLSNWLEGIVALDDVWGLLFFSLIITIANLLHTNSLSNEFILQGLWELGGAITLGVLLGLPAAFLSGRVRTGDPTLVEALALVILCAGLSVYLEVSYLLAAITMGITIAYFAKHHEHAFHEIEHIEWPFLVLFLILIGASFEPQNLNNIYIIAFGYIVLRVVGRIAGAHISNQSHLLSLKDKSYMGLSLLPQAGVALGTALYAKQYFPELGNIIITITISATIIFELLGPIVTRWSLRQTPDLNDNKKE